jgi:hypothetical protein
MKGEVKEFDGQQVVVAIVTTGELVRAIEAESNVLKTEAMAQRSYDVHRHLTNTGPQGGQLSFEQYVEMNEALDADREPAEDG